MKVIANLGDVASRLGGYITVGRSLLGKTPEEIERDLGLVLGELATGARIYKFTRLPAVSEYEYDLTADHPAGLAYRAPYSGERDYPAGSRTVHQWRIKNGIQIPVDPNYLDLKPGQRFPYDWLSS